MYSVLQLTAQIEKSLSRFKSSSCNINVIDNKVAFFMFYSGFSLCLNM